MLPSKIPLRVQRVGEIVGWEAVFSARPNPGNFKVNHFPASLIHGHRPCFRQSECIMFPRDTVFQTHVHAVVIIKIWIRFKASRNSWWLFGLVNFLNKRDYLVGILDGLVPLIDGWGPLLKGRAS